jgi:hypothetical protein
MTTTRNPNPSRALIAYFNCRSLSLALQDCRFYRSGKNVTHCRPRHYAAVNRPLGKGEVFLNRGFNAAAFSTGGRRAASPRTCRRYSARGALPFTPLELLDRFAALVPPPRVLRVSTAPLLRGDSANDSNDRLPEDSGARRPRAAGVKTLKREIDQLDLTKGERNECVWSKLMGGHRYLARQHAAT